MPIVDPLPAAFVRQAMTAEILSLEREHALLSSWKNNHDHNALEEILRAHQRLSISAARRHARSGMSEADLVQQGNLGLLTAAERFDPAHGARFATYARWWVMAAVKEFILRNGSIIALGTTAQAKQAVRHLLGVKSAREARGETVSAADLTAAAERLGMTPRRVEAIYERLNGRDLSLDEPLDEAAGATLGDALADPAPTAEADLIAADAARTLRTLFADALAALTDRERYVVRRRHLDDRRAMLRELAGELGISKERVRQVEARALAKLRRHPRLAAAAAHGFGA